MNDHDSFVSAALEQFAGSTVEFHRSAAEIHGRILNLLGMSLDRAGAVLVRCPECAGSGCVRCSGGETPFATVKNDQGARLELGSRILAYATETAEAENRYWMAEAQGALERRRSQLTGGR